MVVENRRVGLRRAQVGGTAMADENDEKEGKPDIYPLRVSSAPETVIAPSDSGDIFAIKKENVSRLGSLIGMTLGEGVFLCQAYRLDKRLSHDEMGETWVASDLQESRNVVIYLPPLEKRKDDTTIEPIRQNAKHVEALEHPRIVPLLDNLVDPEHGFFTVRKFVNGKTLDIYRKDYVKRHGKLAPTKIIKILNDIAHALDYAHSVEIVHGDLCLKNILIGLDDEVYVDNFALLPVPAATASVERKPYLSPEVAEGHDAIAHSDTYALAVIAYNLLSGRLPLLPDTVNDTPLPIPGVPSTVDAVIRKAMTKDPEDRFDSCGAFIKALETSFQESKKIKSVTVTPSSKSLRKKTGSHVVIGATLLGLLCVLGGVAAVFYRLSFTPEPPTTEVEVAVEIEADKTAMAETEMPQPVKTPAQETEPPSELPSEPLPPVPPLDLSPVPSEEPAETLEEIVLTEILPVTPPVPPVLTDEPEVSEGPQDNNVPPPLAPEEPPLPDRETEIYVPKQDPTESSNEAKPVRSISLTDVMRAEGETTEIIIGGIKYPFHWCKPLPMGHNGFWIQETPVSQESWQDVMNGMRRQPADGRQLPVRVVPRNECNGFAQRLNDDPNILANEEFAVEYVYRFSLPTAEQWDYAHHLGVLKTTNGVQEWCSDENEKGEHAVRNPQNWRIPREQGYENVGFRLVIVP